MKKSMTCSEVTKHIRLFYQNPLCIWNSCCFGGSKKIFFGDIFVYNKKPVDLTVGKQYYMVYTVDEVSHNDLSLAGVAIGQEGNTKYPYVNGKLQYSFGTKLFEVGATYFCRMEVTEEGIVVTELHPDFTKEDIQAATGCELKFSPDLKPYAVEDEE